MGATRTNELQRHPTIALHRQVHQRPLTPKLRHGSGSAMRRARIKWKFTTQKAQHKLARAYPDAAKEL
jgi:hypothetical protein